ncbi:MAG: DUF1559 domain-containing protein [Pirellulaceae bacterium]
MASARKAFTLVELLVSIAIIGLLVALLLPAVQAARESARKSSCSNNLHQIGVAIANYQSLLRIFPTGCIEWRPPGGSPTLKQFAWSALILPYMEETNVSKKIDFHYPFDHPVNAKIAKTELEVYICPSAVDDDRAGRTDYGGLFGQRISNTKPDDGVFVYNRSFGPSDVRDGLSNTMAVAEDLAGPDSEWINGRNVFVQSGGVNDPKAWIGDNEIRSQHTGGAFSLFLDGHVLFLPNEMDLSALAAAITRAEGDVFQP